MSQTAQPRTLLNRRADFPALHQSVNGHPLVYLDSAATSHKPNAVIEATHRFYSRENANVHRGVHFLSQEATNQFEAARESVRKALNAEFAEEIIFTKGCTEGINLVAQSWARNHLNPGDEIILTQIEHHSNIVPWQLVAQQTGAVIRVAPVNDRGELIFEEYEKLLTEKVKLVGAVHISNSIGTIHPISEMVRAAKRVGALMLVDGAQAGPHQASDVGELGVDFYTLSCHKMFAPTGIGVLYGKRDLLESMPPYQGGGSMIRSVTFEETTYAALPDKFEPGTPNIAGVIGLGASIEYLARLNGDRATWEHSDYRASMELVRAHEAELLAYGTDLLDEIPGVRIIGTSANKAAILSFVIDNIHPHDIGQVLDSLGIAVRTGHHCCQPTMKRFGVGATTRASLAMYSNKEDLDQLAAGIRKTQEMFA